MRTFENQQSVVYNVDEKRVIFAEDMNEIGEYINAGPAYMRAIVFVDSSSLSYQTYRDFLIGLCVENNKFVTNVVAKELTQIDKGGYITNNISLEVLDLPLLITTPILKISENPLLTELYLDSLENCLSFELSFCPNISSLDISNLVYSNSVVITDNSQLGGLTHNLPSNLVTFDFSRNNAITVFNNPNWDGCENLTMNANQNLQQIYLDDMLIFQKFNISDNPLLTLIYMPNFIGADSVNISNNPLLDKFFVPTQLQANNFNANGCALDKQSVSDILRALDGGGIENGYCDLSGGTNSVPDGDGYTAMGNLQNKGWTVSIN